MKKVVVLASIALMLLAGSAQALWSMNAPGTIQQGVFGGGSFYILGTRGPVTVSAVATTKCDWYVLDLQNRQVAQTLNQSAASWQLPATTTSGYRVMCVVRNGGVSSVILTARW